MLDIPDLGDDFQQMWRELIRLSKDPPAPWTLIGAHMVTLHGWAKGREQIRPSIDADVLVNVRAVANGTALLSSALKQAGYELEGESPDGIGHRFVKDGTRIDVLGPDGLGRRARLRTIGSARTLQVPGGTQALRRTVRLEVRGRFAQGSVPVPDLLGAILLKSRAIDVDDQPAAQRRDLAFLLTLVDSPEELARGLLPTERGWIQRHEYLSEPSHRCWRGLRGAEDGAIVYRRLANPQR